MFVKKLIDRLVRSYLLMSIIGTIISLSFWLKTKYDAIAKGMVLTAAEVEASSSFFSAMVVTQIVICVILFCIAFLTYLNVDNHDVKTYTID